VEDKEGDDGTGDEDDRLGSRVGGQSSEPELDSKTVDDLAMHMSRLGLNSSPERETRRSPIRMQKQRRVDDEVNMKEEARLTHSGRRPNYGTAGREMDMTLTSQMRPWRGPLPPPRSSPARSINDIIDEALVSRSHISSCLSSFHCANAAVHRRRSTEQK
jgi:hypothetical protein